jgi:hypothetical protein
MHPASTTPSFKGGAALAAEECTKSRACALCRRGQAGRVRASQTPGLAPGLAGQHPASRVMRSAQRAVFASPADAPLLHAHVHAGTLERSLDQRQTDLHGGKAAGGGMAGIQPRPGLPPWPVHAFSGGQQLVMAPGRAPGQRRQGCGPVARRPARHPCAAFGRNPPSRRRQRRCSQAAAAPHADPALQTGVPARWRAHRRSACRGSMLTRRRSPRTWGNASSRLSITRNQAQGT